MIQLTHHLRSFKQAWSTIFKQPVEHIINIIVLALVITVCAAAVSINNNLKIWQKKNIAYPQMVIYLDKSASQADITKIENLLTKQVSIHNFQFISKQQGLAELQQDERLKEIASDVVANDENPLPDILVINTATADQTELQRLNLQLSQLPQVENVQLNLDYAGKISDLIKFANKISLLAQILFSVVLCLVVYNMVRLQMLLKSDAILVARLIGASDSCIMRPLIHYAVWQVTLATLLAQLCVHSVTNLINQLLANFGNLFAKNTLITQLPLNEFIGMWLILVVFTIFTVFLAVRWVFSNTQTN